MAKRKAAELARSDPYDSEEIRVGPTRLPSRALRNVPIADAQNKRRRVVDCVLVPVNRETKKLMQIAECFVPQSRRKISTLSRTPSGGDELELADSLSASPEPVQDETLARADRSENRAVGQHRSSDEPSSADQFHARRPRRSAARKSYVAEIEFPDDSADDLGLAGPPVTKKQSHSKQRATSLSSEDEDEPVIAAGGPEEDYDYDDLEIESDGLVDTEDEKPAATAKRKVSLKDPSATSNPVVEASRKMSKEMKNLTHSSRGLDLSLPPMHEVDDIFSDLTKRALPLGLEEAVRSLGSKRLRVATMCSGTESPLLAIEMIQDALRLALGTSFEVEHLFSAEVTAFKQAYIERNFNPPIIFRDIRELVTVQGQDVPMATTAYGAKVAVPTDVHVVIAGTSCVDFSRVNNHRKDINEVGESSDTWNAVLSYCKAFRPAIVILENVKTAFWDHMLQDYKKAGYEPAGAYVDSKNYYVPQTRQRGYMVCFDKSLLRQAGLKTAGEDWKDSMDKLQRRASSPVSSFLLPTTQIASRPLQVNENLKDVDWSKCETRQISYRLRHRLGVRRPITHWLENGTISPPDYGSRPWHTAQVERVLDTLEAATLKKARAGYDARFKTRIWDLSQNTDRIHDSNHFGIIGCITPTGINFVSDAWRQLAAEECLVLHGIPLNKISFTVENNANIQDLAGNAMSAPLVGAAFLSSIIAGHKMFDQVGESRPTAVRSPVKGAPELIAPAMHHVSTGSSKQHVNVDNLSEHVKRALRRCYCEGSFEMAQHGIQECADCRHTTCIACGGNPEHRYQKSRQLSAGRTPMAVFEEKIRPILPLKLTLPDVPERLAEATSEFFESVQPLSSAVFSLSHIRRSSCIHVVYTAPEGRLVLLLEEGRARWLLFARVPPEAASNSPLREALTIPVATAHIDQDLLGAPWSWRKPTESVDSISFSGYGEQLPTWQARMEMPEFRDDWQWQYLTVEATTCGLDIGGTYQYLPKCGTANESMYKRMEPTADRPVYLFLDPTRVGPPEDDCFVFAHDHCRLEYDEVRSVIARVSPFWKPWTQAKDKTNVEICYHEWSEHAQSKLKSMGADIALHRPTNLALAAQGTSCREGTIITKADVDIQHVIRKHRTQGGFIQLDDHRFFEATAWIFEAMRRQLPMNEWTELVASVPSTCAECAPAKPALRWQKSNGKAQISSYEDPYAASMYERAVKQRQSPVLVHADSTSLQLGLNLLSLAHRAQSRLQGNGGDTSFHWRLATSQMIDRAGTKKFHLKPTGDLQPCEEDVGMSVKLFTKQRLQLAWMREQEAGLGKKVILEEVEEADLPHLGWRVEMRARRTAYVKGGICADHPGFGKTITSLALVQSEWLQQGSSVLKTQAAALAQQAGITGFLPSSATVIICPKLLVDQWHREARKKWDSEEGICTIKEAGDLKNYTVKDFESAKLIIVSRRALASPAYTERLAAFAAVPGPCAERGRAHALWMKHAAMQVPEHLVILAKSSHPGLIKHLRTKYASNVRSDEYREYVPSVRLKGQKYVEAQAKKHTGSSDKVRPEPSDSPPAQLSTKLIGPPLLEMYFFQRIIVDEFHDCPSREFEAIAALKADKRWGLSGTPALADCYEIAQIGRLLNVPLRIGSIQRGLMKQHNIRLLHREMTDFERFDAARTTPSFSQNIRIHEQAQQFLDTFARRNLSDFDELSVQQHIVPVSLSIDHYALYHELCQHLNSSDMKIRKSTKTRQTDRQKQYEAAVKNSATAEEALSKSAAFPRFVSSDVLPGGSSIWSWLEKREEEIVTLIEDLSPELAKAYKHETEEYFSWRKARIDANELRDKETAILVKELCHKVDGGNTSAKSSSGGRDSTSKANMLVTRLVTSRRSIRYLMNVHRLQALTSGTKDKPKKCDDAGCRYSLTAHDEVAVSGLCGHLVCYDCYQRTLAKDLTKCCAEGCGENMSAHHLLWNTKISHVRNTMSSPYGAKIDAALDILEGVRKKGEQAILFVQYDSQLIEIEQALLDRGIPAAVVKATTLASARNKIARFQDGGEETVIVLNVSTETAAGLNLQQANHVIFLSPLLRATQYEYDSTLAQAIGRVRRHGQTKEIHVYRILALNTIDVDILEHRERRTDVLTEQGGPTILPPPVAKRLNMRTQSGDEPQPERTQLVKENGRFSLRPQSWLVKCGTEDEEGGESDDVSTNAKGTTRVLGWEDFSSLVKFSRGFTEDDE